MRRLFASVALASGAVAAGAQPAAGFECLLEPWQVLEMRTAVDGLVATVAVNRGDTIRRGQVLATLASDVERLSVDAARYRARMEGQVASARNRVDYATRKLARLVDLEKEQFTSAQVRDEAAAEKRLAESELQSATEVLELARIEARRAEEQLAQRTLTAPFNGVVVDRLLNPGDLAEAGSGRKPMLKVAQIDPIRADVALPAALFGQVKVGARATVTAAVGGGRFDGVVRQVDRVIDAASATFVARVEVPNPQGRVPGGSRCTATIVGLASPALPAARAPEARP
jgi:RND family efflux transporter MFP subunit